MLDAIDVNCSIGSFKLSLKSFLISPLYKAACQELLKFDVWDEWLFIFFFSKYSYFFISKNGTHKIFVCPLCHCCYIPRMWIRIRVYVWRWVSGCKSIYTSMYVLVFTYISVHMGNDIFLLHIKHYLWMICPMQLLFNFGNKLIFIVIVIVIAIAMSWSQIYVG